MTLLKAMLPSLSRLSIGEGEEDEAISAPFPDDVVNEIISHVLNRYGIKCHIETGEDDDTIADVSIRLLKPDANGNITMKSRLWFSQFSSLTQSASFESNEHVHNTLAMLFSKGWDRLDFMRGSNIEVYPREARVGTADSMDPFTGVAKWTLFDTNLSAHQGFLPLPANAKLAIAKEYVNGFLNGMKTAGGDVVMFDTQPLFSSSTTPDGELMFTRLEKISVIPLEYKRLLNQVDVPDAPDAPGV